MGGLPFLKVQAISRNHWIKISPLGISYSRFSVAGSDMYFEDTPWSIFKKLVAAC